MSSDVCLHVSSCFKTKSRNDFCMALKFWTTHEFIMTAQNAKRQGSYPAMHPCLQPNRIFTSPRWGSAFTRTSSAKSISSCRNRKTITCNRYGTQLMRFSWHWMTNGSCTTIRMIKRFYSMSIPYHRLEIWSHIPESVVMPSVASLIVSKGRCSIWKSLLLIFDECHVISLPLTSRKSQKLNRFEDQFKRWPVFRHPFCKLLDKWEEVVDQKWQFFEWYMYSIDFALKPQISGKSGKAMYY